MLPNSKLLQDMGLNAEKLNEFVESAVPNKEMLAPYKEDGKFLTDADVEAFDSIAATIEMLSHRTGPVDYNYEGSKKIEPIWTSKTAPEGCYNAFLHPISVDYYAYQPYGGYGQWWVPYPVLNIEYVDSDGKRKKEPLTAGFLQYLASWDPFGGENYMFNASNESGIQRWLRVINTLHAPLGIIDQHTANKAKKYLFSLEMFLKAFYTHNWNGAITMTAQRYASHDTNLEKEFEEFLKQFENKTLKMLYRMYRAYLINTTYANPYMGFASGTTGEADPMNLFMGVNMGPTPHMGGSMGGAVPPFPPQGNPWQQQGPPQGPPWQQQGPQGPPWQQQGPQGPPWQQQGPQGPPWQQGPQGPPWQQGPQGPPQGHGHFHPGMQGPQGSGQWQQGNRWSPGYGGPQAPVYGQPNQQPQQPQQQSRPDDDLAPAPNEPRETIDINATDVPPAPPGS